MNGKYLLDTNAVIALFKDDVSVKEKLHGKKVLLPCIVLGELYFGAFKSEKIDKNIEKIKRLSLLVPILNCSHNTASHYGFIKSQLLKKGHPLPENDLWIAAIAIEYDLILISRDVHFGFIDGLQTESW